jgi:hypothetical protein
MAFQQYNVYDGLTAVRIVDIANLAGTYFNGQVNNGVGATLTVTATGVLTIDSVALNSGDSILLVAQTAANQNGIYIVSNPGATGIQPVLTRRADEQNIEQIRAGQFVTVGAGTVNNGTVWSIVEPLPAQFGISNFVWVDSSGLSGGGLGTASTKAASNNAQPSVASVSGATVIGDLAMFADTAGTVTDSTIAASNVVVKNAVNVMAAGSAITMAKVNGTEAANAVTASGVAGLLTTSALTTAGAGNYAITWTNTFITATSSVLIMLAGGTNTTENITIKCAPGAGTATLTIYNNTAATALNGTILMSYLVM